MRGITATGVVVLAALLVAGCDSGSGDGRHGDPGTGNRAKPVVKLKVPSAYDPAKGWDQTFDWLPPGAGSAPVTAVPAAGALAVLEPASGGYRIRMRDADTGKDVWTSAAWTPPGAGDLPEDASVPLRKDAEVPALTTVDQGGHSYVVAAVHGIGTDEGSGVERLEVYAADAKGSAVKPLRGIDVPVTAEPDVVEVTASGGRLLVSWTGAASKNKQTATAVDVTTGRTDTYQNPDTLLPQCKQAPHCTGRVVAATEHGPLIAASTGGFGVPGRWFSDSVHPGGVPAKTPNGSTAWNGTVYGAGDGHVVAHWYTGSRQTWSVHDAATGALQASVTCAFTGEGHDQDAGYPVFASARERYVGAGPVVFDLKRKTGLCLTAAAGHKTFVPTALADDGTAYCDTVEYQGTQDTDTNRTVVQLDLTRGTDAAATAKPLGDLGKDIYLPYVTDLDGTGLFVAADADWNPRVSLRVRR